MERARAEGVRSDQALRDRKSTRLNSSHTVISYAVFCLKQKRTRLNTSHTVISRALDILTAILDVGPLASHPECDLDRVPDLLESASREQPVLFRLSARL